MKRRRIEVSIEKQEVWVIKRPRRDAVWCGECAERVGMFPPEEVARLYGVSPRNIYQWMEAGRLHFTETMEGEVFVCLASVSANLG